MLNDLNDSAEDTGHMIKQGKIKTKKQLAAILIHEFLHWAYNNDYELFWKIDDLE